MSLRKTRTRPSKKPTVDELQYFYRRENGLRVLKKSSQKSIAIKATELTEEASVLLSPYQAFIVILWNIIGDHFLLGV